MEANDETKENDILNLNRTAMNSLKDQNYSKALKSLKKASVLIKEVEKPEKRMKLQGITLNNFGCFYKRSKMPNVALKYLTKACLREKEGLVDNVGIAATHLNMCAIYSELGKHDLALQEGLISLELMKRSLEYTPNFISTLVIAYHNTGVEYEFLKSFREAYECYRLAWETALQHLGPEHPLTLSTKENCSCAEKKVQDQEMRLTKDSINREHTVEIKRIRFRSAEKRPKSIGESKPRHKYNFTLRENLSPKITKELFVGTRVEPVLHTMRFLTGERLQPMFKTELRVTSLPRGTIKLRNDSSSVPEKNKTIGLGRDRGTLNIRKRKIKSYPIRIGHDNTQEVNQRVEEIKKNQAGVLEVSQKQKKIEGILKLSDKRFKISEENKKKIQEKRKKPESKWENPEENGRFEIDTTEIDSLINEALPNFGLLQMEQALDNEAALKIQKTFRGFKVRKSIQQIKKPKNLNSETFKILEDLNALKIKKQINLFNQEGVGLDIIPEIPDAASPASEELIKDSLSIVQGLFKGYLARKDLLRQIKAAIFIQKHIRRFVVVKIYKKIKEAILFIQSSYRDYILKKKLKKVNQ